METKIYFNLAQLILYAFIKLTNYAVAPSTAFAFVTNVNKKDSRTKPVAN